MSLERELRALAVDFPPEPDVAARVLSRLGRPERRPTPRWLVPVLVVVAASAALLAIPQTRAAILRFLDIGGVRIERVETQPRAPARTQPLGAEVSLATARAAVEFELLVPEGDTRVYYDPTVPGGMVNIAWDGLVLSQWRGEQLPFVQKQVGPGSTLEQVDVAGAPGVWLAGARHEIVFGRPGGEVHAKTRRLAGNVLIWERGGVTYRLEGRVGKARALAVARDLFGP